MLTDLKKRVNASLTHLRQRVARRFSVISTDFQVFVNDNEITLQDRNYLGKLEYALVYGGFDESKFEHDERYVVRREENTVVGEQGQYSVRGWIGLVKESGTFLNDVGLLYHAATGSPFGYPIWCLKCSCKPSSNWPTLVPTSK